MKHIIKVFAIITGFMFFLMSSIMWMMYAVENYHDLVTLFMMSVFIASAVVFGLLVDKYV